MRDSCRRMCRSRSQAAFRTPAPPVPDRQSSLGTYLAVAWVFVLTFGILALVVSFERADPEPVPPAAAPPMPF